MERHPPHQLHRSASPASLTPSGSTTAPPRWTASTRTCRRRERAAAPSPHAPATAVGWRSANSGGAWQAVAVRSPGLMGANFWQPGTVGPLTASAPASALVRSNHRTAILHISEPPRTGVPPEITRHHPVPEVNSEDVSVEVPATGRSPRL
ncbi:polysaccharide lyase beta-sandwich domain-containing protein [Streptomyces maoxianensis]|uniref:Polysaccharide lyase beta-sandwich domain-containing protein n=1 Tax=Streptomyces maoxianensis TaxID=1459942 RepID=A0ABV9GBH7_9ACTN